jgi:hypothetical protein
MNRVEERAENNLIILTMFLWQEVVKKAKAKFSGSAKDRI